MIMLPYSNINDYGHLAPTEYTESIFGRFWALFRRFGARKSAAIFLIALAIFTSSSPADARSVKKIAWAIAKTGGPKNAIGLAKVIKREAKRVGCDPFTLVSFFWHESSWRSSAVGDGGRAIGLGQSWSWLYSPACGRGKAIAKALTNPSAACAAKRDALKIPAVAIRMTASSIKKARQVCRQKTKRAALFHRWLSLLGGRNHPRKAYRGVWCAQRRVTIGKGRKRRRVWRDIAWRQDPRFKGIREIVDCRRSLLKGKRCRREIAKKKKKRRRRSKRKS